ncbi:MAG: hypothetical protein AAF718_02580 [Pseudomonadota bacterium]
MGKRQCRWAGIAIATLLSCVAASSGMAQERVTPEMFLEFAMGRTLTFNTFPDGQLVGVEEYLRPNLSVWRDRSETCVYGRITLEDGQICFLYDNDPDDVPVCWVPFIEGDRWFVFNSNGVSGEIQEITDVSDSGLQCPVKPGV